MLYSDLIKLQPVDLTAQGAPERYLEADSFLAIGPGYEACPGQIGVTQSGKVGVVKEISQIDGNAVSMLDGKIDVLYALYTKAWDHTDAEEEDG